jgi:hypothetical protein
MAEVGCLKDGCFQNLEVNGVQFPGKVPIIALGAARTVLPSESGTTFTIESSGGAYAITLPTVSLGRGCRYRFVAAENTPTADITISSNDSNIKGVIHVQSDTAESNLISVTGHTSVLFDTTCLIGDWIELIGDGTNYWVSGRGSIQACFTLAGAA